MIDLPQVLQRAVLRSAGPLTAALASLMLSACGTVGYYSQAIRGQWEILRKAHPIAEVMADKNVPSRTKHKLEVAEDVRRFAQEELALPADRQYDRYSDLGRKYVSWIVYAAPEFSVKGKTWWYPLVGRLEYRGFFSKEAARAEAAMQKAHGLEVYAGGVSAYSTLGWFHDPVLNTFFRGSDADLAELLIHELTHVRVFLPGDTDFNEALATANSEAGVRRWLAAKKDRRGLQRYEAELAKDRQIVHLLLETREKLRSLYQNASLSTEGMRAEKVKVFAEMRHGYGEIRRRWHGDSRYDRAFALPWNNARLNTVATYYDLVPGFERLLQSQGGNPARFYAAVEAMRHLGKKERRALLKRTRADSMHQSERATVASLRRPDKSNP